jgi:cytochrome P450
VTTNDGNDIYYDPFDVEIDNDPHPLWKRMREEAPLYYNGKYNFYALSRFDDVEKALVDWDTYRSAGIRCSNSFWRTLTFRRT